MRSLPQRAPWASLLALVLVGSAAMVGSCPTGLSNLLDAFDCGATTGAYAPSGSYTCNGPTATLTQAAISARSTNPYVVGDVLDSNLAVAVTCAAIAEMACTGLTGDTATCIGCSAAPTVTVSGLGDYEVGGTCASGCTCNASGVATYTYTNGAGTTYSPGGAPITVHLPTEKTNSTGCEAGGADTCAANGYCTSAGVYTVTGTCTNATDYCECVTTCTCDCAENACNYTEANEVYTATSRTGTGTKGTCKVNATCPQGLYDGGAFTEATATMMTISLMQDGTTRKTVTAGSTDTDGFLIGTTANVSATPGTFSFSSLAVSRAVASATKPFTLDFTIGSLIKNVTTSSAAFLVRPASMRYAWDSVPTGLVAGAAKTHTFTQELTLSLYNRLGQQITGVLVSDTITAKLKLQANPDDHSNSTGLADAADAGVETPSCTFSDSATCVFTNGTITVTDGYGGYFYKLKAYDNKFDSSAPGAYSVLTGFFHLDPADIVAKNAAGAAYADGTFPKVILVDGVPSDTIDSEGFPTSLKIELVDADGAALAKAKCLSCVSARLVRCVDNVPTSTIALANTSETGDYGYVGTTCTLVKQAACNTDSADGSVCTSNNNVADGGQWTHTLTSTTASTLADVAAGMATFANLQANYVVGSGFRLRFVFNPFDAGTSITYNPTTASFTSFSTTAAELQSGHSNGLKLFPDSALQACPACSFVIRPYEIVVAQQVGGDGVDLGVGGGDGVDGTPDGVGDGLVFRVQPAITLRGNGYDFDKNWAYAAGSTGGHGHIPVTAAVKTASCTQVGCGALCTAAECATGPQVVIETANTVTSGVSPQYTKATTAIANAGASGELSSQYENAPAGPLVDVEAKYQASLGKIGYVWRDLKAYTVPAGGNENVVLRFMVGIDCHLVTNVITTAGAAGKCTGVDSAPFDIFVKPNPPTNLRVFSYGALGFRLEFDPGAISRMKPLSGFIIELDTCAQGDANSTGNCARHSPIYPSTDALSSELGSDYYSGGGHTEDLFISWSTTLAGAAAAGTVTFTPMRTLMSGDTLILALGTPGAAADIAGSTSTCTPTGNNGADFTVTIDPATTTVTLEAAATMLRGIPVQVILGTNCKIYQPLNDPAGDTTYLASVTVGSRVQSTSFYGTSAISGAPPTLPTYIVAPVIGSNDTLPGRFDNCNGNGCTAFAGTSHFALRTLQDASSMDLDWGGALRYGARGVRCATRPSVGNSTPFPAERTCTDQTEGYAFANAGGDNGRPIGTNPGSGTTQYGASYLSTNDQCRRMTFSNSQNPCALSVGAGWTVGVGLVFTYSSGLTTSAVVATMTHARAIRAGSTISFSLPVATGDGGYPSANSVSITSADTGVSASALVDTWSANYSQTSATAGTITIITTTDVPAHSPVEITLTITLTLSSAPAGVVGEVAHGDRTTLIIRNGGVKATMTAATGAPVQSYTESTTPFAITASGLYSFRVTAYNGRFRSDPATTSVFNRAVERPAAPGYLPQQTQEIMGVVLQYSIDTPDNATEIGMVFAPPVDLTAGMTVGVPLPNFRHDEAFVTIAAGSIAGRTEIAGGSGGENYTSSGTDDTIFPTGSWTANSSTLVLTVADGQELAKGVEHAIFIDVAVGLRNPTTAHTRTAYSTANISALRLDWLTPFPKKSAPRQGFVVQYSTDRLFSTDVQTVAYPDQLNTGVVELGELITLTGAVTANETTVTVGTEAWSGKHLNVVGKLIKVDSEYMRVTAATATTFTVVRAQLGSSAVAHTATTGTPADPNTPCACNSAGAVSAGAGTCACKSVYLAYAGATNPARNNGKDNSVGVGCEIGGAQCNPDNVDYRLSQRSAGFRTHQTGAISTGVNPMVDWLSTSCDESCTSVTLQRGREFSNPTSYGAVSVANAGDILTYPKLATTTIQAGLNISASPDANTLIVAGNAAQLVRKYIKVNDEFMYVERVTTGVSALSFASQPGRGCNLGDGILVEKSSTGGGFSGSFTLDENGTIDSVTITTTGSGYRAGKPTIKPSAGTLCNSSYPSLGVTLSSNIVIVQRGALGSTIAAHAPGDTIYRLWWPTQGSVAAPGLQHYFRVASYGPGGFSNWKYYAQNYDNHNPTLIPTVGNEQVEFILTGMGITARNHSIWFTHRNPDGSPDWARSRECVALLLLDVAGTRVKCTAPAWDGREHDVLFRYKNGLVERLQFLSNGIRYRAPTVTSVVPALVPAGRAVTVTITGADFGQMGGNRSAVLNGGVGNVVPCAPLTFVSNTVLHCALAPRANQRLVGDIVVTVGTNGAGGAQSSSTSGASRLRLIPSPVALTVALNLGIETIPVGSPQRLTFVANFVADVVASQGSNLKPWQVNVTSITAGSVIVAFVILPDPSSSTAFTPAQIAASIAKQAADPASVLLSGSVTSAVTGATLPPGVLEEANALAGVTVTATAEPSYFTTCVPRSYSSFDMEMCYDCCAYKCETGNEIPAVGGVPVLPGYRAQACQSQCLGHCGYNIPISVLNTM